MCITKESVCIYCWVQMYNKVKSGHMTFNQSDFSIGIMCVIPWAAVCWVQVCSCMADREFITGSPVQCTKAE